MIVGFIFLFSLIFITLIPNSAFSEELTIILQPEGLSPVGELVTISGQGAIPESIVSILIISPLGENFDEYNVIADSQGHYSVLWVIPSDAPFGEYIIRATNQAGIVETTFHLDEILVGGEFISVNISLLLTSGIQTTASWLVPIIVSLIGLGFLFIKRK